MALLTGGMAALGRCPQRERKDDQQIPTTCQQQPNSSSQQQPQTIQPGEATDALTSDPLRWRRRHCDGVIDRGCRKAIYGRVRAAATCYIACQAVLQHCGSVAPAGDIAWTPSWPLDPVFATQHYVLANFTAPDTDTTRWEPLLRQAEEILSSRMLWIPGPESAFARSVRQLVPWHLERVTVSRAPKVRRFLSDVPHTHRGAALLYSDRSIEIESQDIAELHTGTLKRRFDKPVAIAIFWYGVPARVPEPHDLQVQPDGVSMRDPEARPSAHVDPTPIARPAAVKRVQCSPGIYFLVPKHLAIGDEVPHLLGRLHASLGHPDKKALARLLLSQQVPAQHIKLLDGMHCDHCARNAQPRPPRSSTLPREEIGAFAEHVSADIFYVHMLDGTTVQVLQAMGIICHTTRLHAGVRLESRESRHVLRSVLDRMDETIRVHALLAH
eukprot:6398325-Amphidinium_carterae.1